ALGRVRVAPDGGEVDGQREDTCAVLGVGGDAIGGALTLVLGLRLGEGTQLAVPVGFQRLGDEAIGRVHLHVPVPRVVGLVLRPLDLATPYAIGLVQARLDLTLHGQRQLERLRRHGVDQQLADGGIDLRAEDALTQGLGVAPAAARADVIRHELTAAPGAVADLHPAAAQPADDAALQQGRPFAGRALPALPPPGLRARRELAP